MLALLLPLLLVAPAKVPVGHFSCMAGTKRIQVVQAGDKIIYTFGPPGRPEITLTGSPAGGVYYHRELYSRGEDQTLRFVSGAYDYVVFNRWQNPYELSTGERPPEINASGLLIFKEGKLLRRINCKGGDLREWPIFKRLMPDEGNRTPDDAGE